MGSVPRSFSGRTKQEATFREAGSGITDGTALATQLGRV